MNNYCSGLYTHKKLMWIEVHIHSVKVKSQAGNGWVKDMTTQKGQSERKSARGLRNLDILLKNSAEGLGSNRVLLGLCIYENTPPKMTTSWPQMLLH